jgi:putative FmdB family regulatory protein
MPIYEYHCEHCGEFEEMQRITDPPLARCPRCRRKVRRLISSTSFQLKGTGWYVTDYARAGGGGGKKKDGGEAAESKAETKTDTKTDTKTETKTETKAVAGGEK